MSGQFLEYAEWLRARLPSAGRVRVTAVVWGLGGCALALQAWSFVSFARWIRDPPLATGALHGHDAAPLNVQSIQSAHLFGAPPADPAAAQATTLPLSLTGIIATDDPLRGFGIIGESASATRLYGVGAALPGAATLYQVFADRVVLQRDGQFETLRLPHTSGPTLLASLTLPASRPAEEKDKTPDSEGAPPPVMPAAWFANLAPEAVATEQTFEGFRLHASARYEKQGLQTDDLLVAINGTPMNGAASARIALARAGGKNVTLTVRRNGVPLEVTIDPNL